MEFRSEVHPDIPYVLFGCKCSMCQRFGGPNNQPHCSYCEAGIDRTAETGGKTFIHILTRGADGQMLKWRPCTRQQQ